jgi:multiple sugar transport system permease protein
VSFRHETGFGTGRGFVGIENYVALLSSRDFWSVLVRTVAWTTSSVCLKALIGLGGALLLNEELLGRGVFRAMTLPPWLIPLPIGAYVWAWLYNGQHGLLNGFLLRIGLIDKPFEMLAYPSSAFLGCLINDVWVGVPFMTLVLLAGLQAIPNELYQAADIDGASRWNKLRYVTLPQLKTVLLIATLLSAVWTFNSFDIIWVQTGGGPLNATTTLVIKTYKTAFKSWDFGMASSLAVITFIILTIASVFYSRFILTKDRA